MNKDDFVGFGGAGLNNPQPQPDIDKALIEFANQVFICMGDNGYNEEELAKIKHALYQRLASEAEEYGVSIAETVKAVPLSKLAELFGVAPKSNVGGDDA